MADDDKQDSEPTPTQHTKPAKGKPVEIPVPNRGDWQRVLKRASRPVPQEPNKDQAR